jgi:hypothetical protein
MGQRRVCAGLALGALVLVIAGVRPAQACRRYANDTEVVVTAPSAVFHDANAPPARCLPFGPAGSQSSVARSVALPDLAACPSGAAILTQTKEDSIR